MKKDNALSPKSSKRRQTIRGSRRPLMFTLVLIFSVVTLAVGSAWLPSKISASRLEQDAGDSQSISAAALQQIQALEDEKASRTPAQQKIDSQLLYAMKMERAEPIASGVNSLQVNVGANDQGRVVVDISASVNDKLLQMLVSNGANVLVSTPDYNSVRVEVSLNRLEDIAASDSVYFIQPKQEYMLNSVSSVSGPSAPAVDLRSSADFKNRAQRVRGQLAKALTNLDGRIVQITERPSVPCSLPPASSVPRSRY